jgi:hypothetical protein
MENTKLAESLSSISEAVSQGEAELEKARRELKDCEARVDHRITALVQDVARTVFESNSQALRKQAIRSLYWGAWVKARIIAEVFGVREQAIHSIAGPLVEQTSCEGGCGKQVESTYRSHSDWRGTSRVKHRIPRLCSECRAKRDALDRADYEKQEEERRKEAAIHCSQNGHHWGAEEINGTRAENGIDWISNDRPIRLENANLVSIDMNSIVLQLFCMNWCGATIEKRISAMPD